MLLCVLFQKTDSLKRVGAVSQAVLALVAHAEAIQQLPGADPFLFPNKPGALASPTDVATVFQQRMAALR